MEAGRVFSNKDLNMNWPVIIGYVKRRAGCTLARVSRTLTSQPGRRIMRLRCMKNPIKPLLTLSFVCTALFGVAQTLSFEYQPSFSAVVVRNIDTSVSWYKSVFGLTVKQTMNDAGGGYKITILESPTYMLELLELKGSVPKTEALKSKAAGTETQGHFKVGFRVTNMDACLKHLASLKITVPQVWTDDKTKKRNFLIPDPDGNLLQFFE